MYGLTLRVPPGLADREDLSVLGHPDLRGDRRLARERPGVHEEVVVDLLRVGFVGVRVALPGDFLAVETRDVAAVTRRAVRIHRVRRLLDPLGRRLPLQRLAPGPRARRELRPGRIQLPGPDPVLRGQSDGARQNDPEARRQGSLDQTVAHESSPSDGVRRIRHNFRFRTRPTNPTPELLCRPQLTNGGTRLMKDAKEPGGVLRFRVAHPRGGHMNRSRTALLVGAILTILSALPARAQSSGRIVGTIRNATGGTVSGAPITVTNQETGASRVVRSTTNGTYEAADLPPGMYTVATDVQGFRRVTQRDQRLAAGATMTVDFVLEIRVAEDVTVTAQKREETVHEVPFSVAATTEETMRDRGVQN